jgi:hypothetical protein
MGRERTSELLVFESLKGLRRTDGTSFNDSFLAVHAHLYSFLKSELMCIKMAYGDGRIEDQPQGLKIFQQTNGTLIQPKLFGVSARSEMFNLGRFKWQNN